MNAPKIWEDILFFTIISFGIKRIIYIRKITTIFWSYWVPVGDLIIIMGIWAVLLLFSNSFGLGFFIFIIKKERQTISRNQYRFGNFESILKSLLKYFKPESILSVQLEYLKNPEYLQDIMYRVQEHFGVTKRKVVPLQANNNQINPMYTLPSRASLNHAVEHFCERSHQFYNLIGYRIDWMHHMSDPRLDKYLNQLELK